MRLIVERQDNGSFLISDTDEIRNKLLNFLKEEKLKKEHESLLWNNIRVSKEECAYC
jgi:hypothetical protein